MKLFQALCLVLTLWLTGCATTTPEGTSSTPGAKADKSGYALSSRKPVIPGGGMSPLKSAQATSGTVVHLEPPADLWERIRRGFAMPDLDSDLVRDREQWYTTRPDYIFRMTERSRKYLFHIVEELERRNMPTELALLPFVESAFNPQAVSSAKAAGMWQFMPATGKSFDLKQNVFRDDRRDVLESTRAALDYLQKLYGMFGDWHLALAAYNWGEGSVGRALAKNKRSGLGLSYPELNMPMETRFYVPKLQAIKNIIAQPEAFSATLPLIENHPYFQVVEITRDIDVALAARLAEISLEDFKALNPSLHRPVILAAGTPQILLPWDTAATFQRNLEAHSDHQLASWTAWVAPTTMKTDEAARRVEMDEDDFRRLNQIPPRMMIKAGSTLLVRRSDKLAADVTEHLADNGQVAFTPEIVLRRTQVSARRGESLASLAARYGVTAANLADWNKISASTSLKKGQALVLFTPERAGTTTRAMAKQGSSRTRVAPAPRLAATKRPAATKSAKRR